MNKAINTLTANEKRILKLKQQCKEIKTLKQKLEQHFEFEIIDYIVADIVEHEDYKHFCLMINLAVVNDRLSEENATKLKAKIKEMYHIENDYQKF